jgi:uncharacterized membrane protein YvlD (DUF360 family)
MILLVRFIGNVAAIWVASKVLTLGIALFFVSLVMLLLTSWIVHGFQIDGFWIYVGATIIVWAVNGFVQAIAPKPDDRRRERTR